MKHFQSLREFRYLNTKNSPSPSVRLHNSPKPWMVTVAKISENLYCFRPTFQERKWTLSGRVPSIEIDEEIKEFAWKQTEICMKEQTKKRTGNPYQITETHFRRGHKGEGATLKYLGLPLEPKEYLDMSYDNLYGGLRIDVKTSMIYERLRQPIPGGFRVFVSATEKLAEVDILLFVKLESVERIAHLEGPAHLIGWIWREDFEDEHSKVSNEKMYAPAYAIYYKYMHHVDLLKGGEFPLEI